MSIKGLRHFIKFVGGLENGNPSSMATDGDDVIKGAPNRRGWCGTLGVVALMRDLGKLRKVRTLNY